MRLPQVTVLRLEHRMQRDQRLTTHVFLTARALGAIEGIFSGDQDENLIQTVGKLVDDWGGNFTLSWTPRWKRFLQERKSGGARIIHLTMYGKPLQEGIAWLRNPENQVHQVVVVVGGAKVPGVVYGLADLNVSVGNQPHSEVTALAILLYDWFGKSQLYADLQGRKRIIPSATDKQLKILPEFKPDSL
ncbi:MAG: tRNA (cytidine(56)-2'-O)-methyltransferase [Candidatus Heimdallarchaeota archaeon]